VTCHVTVVSHASSSSKIKIKEKEKENQYKIRKIKIVSVPAFHNITEYLHIINTSTKTI